MFGVPCADRARECGWQRRGGPGHVASTSVGRANDATAGAMLLPAAAAGHAAVPGALESCDPGAYVGNYECHLVFQQGEKTETKIEGTVAFDLELNQSTTQGKCKPGQEFCDDLVITEGSGKLFGFVLGLIGFETGLKGGLNCSTGEFHAEAVGGVYGIPWPNPDDPEGKLKVTIELGTFDGSLNGRHGGKVPQTIAGEWNLGEPSLDIYCPGPFSVQLMR